MKTLSRSSQIVTSLIAVALAGCSPAKTDKIVIRGSNTVGEELAPRLIAEYKKANAGVEFDLEFKGTTYGMGALMVERCDIAAASRPASTNELDLASSRSIAFNNYVIGSYTVAVVVNSGNTVSDLSADQVRDIFTGAVTNWSEVGGSEAPIKIYIRDPISGTHLGFKELAMNNREYGPEPGAFTNYLGIVEAVARDAHGIGYTGIDQTTHAGIKAIAVGGVSPTVENVNSGKYPYARTLRLYTNKAKETARAKAFIDFIQSKQGQEIVASMGYAPRKL